MRNTVRSTIDAFIHFFGDKTGRPTQSIRFPKKLIYYYLSIFRNAVLYEEIKKRKDVDLSLYQTLPCVELIAVDVVADCPCAPEKGCKWLKSKYPIPILLHTTPETVITLDGSIKFDFVPWYDFSHTICSRYKGTRESPYYTFKNVGGNFHLYIYSNAKITETTELESVALTGIFKNPLEAISFPVCGKKGDECEILDLPFVIPHELEARVFMETYRAVNGLERYMMPNGDVLNNDNNDSVSRVGL